MSAFLSIALSLAASLEAPSAYLDDIPALTNSAAMAGDPQWLRLAHYVPAANGFKSDVIAQNFYLSPEGRTSPESELAATIAAMKAPVGEDPNLHAQCRFPARYLWINSVGLLDSSTPAVECPNYLEWRGAAPESISVIFASGMLHNPATFYGHMLLRLDAPSQASTGERMMSNTLNYGADFPPNENPLLYVGKGLFGGYHSRFSTLPFYSHDHRYTEERLKDVWAYTLDLDADQMQLVSAHSWEMLESLNRYYFLRQNCAYRIAEIVSVVLDESVVPADKPWILPVDVLQAMALATNRGRPLVRSIERLESSRTRFNEQYDRLNGGLKSRVRAIINEPDRTPDDIVVGLSESDQSRVLEVALEHYTIDHADAEKPPPPRDFVVRRGEVLLARLNRAPGRNLPDLPRPAPPHRGQQSALTMASYTDNSRLGQGLRVRLRGAYNDFLTPPGGAALPFSELSFGDIVADLREDGVSLRSVDIVKVTSLNIAEADVGGERQHAWRVRFGAEQASIGCDGCLVAFAEGGYGAATKFGPGFAGYAFANGRAASPELDEGWVSVGASAGLIVLATKRLRAHAEAGVWQDLDGDGRALTYARAEARFAGSENFDLVASAATENTGSFSTTEFSIGGAFYW